MTIFALSLILFAGNVKAEEQYCATLMEKASVKFQFQLTQKTLYIASLKDSTGGMQLAFCLNPGYSIDNATKNAYIRKAAGSNITYRMRVAYEYGRKANINTQDGQLKYLTAQVAIWEEATNPNASDGTFRTNFNRDASEALVTYLKSNKVPENLIGKIQTDYRNNFLEELDKGNVYKGKLYVYEYKNGGRYQKFLTGLPGNVCPNDTVVKDPDKTYCPSPNDSIDITACINSGKEYAECVSENCPNTNTCPDGYGVKVVGNPPVCVNDNQMTTAKYHTEMDTSVCGTTIEEGTLETKVSDYCKLYCKEEVYVNYPGGISSPISLGTSIVWPTSTATEHTVWKNLYSLSYRGYKTCKLVIANDTKVSEDYNNAIDIVNRYRSSYETIRRNGGTCENTYSKALSDAKANLNKVNEEVKTVENQVNSIKQTIGQYESQKAKYEQEQNQANGNLAKCQSQAKTNCEKVGQVGYQNCYNEYINKNCSRYQTEAASAAGAIGGINESLNSFNVQLATANSNLRTVKEKQTQAQNEVTRYENHIKYCGQYFDSYEMASKIITELNTCANYSISPEDLYQFTSDTSISYDDNEYGATYSLIGNTQYACDGCNAEYHYEFDKSGCNTVSCLTNLMKTIDERTISVTAITTYSLPDNIYRYVSKKDNKPLVSPIGDVIDVGYSFLPTSYNAKVGKLYNLNIIVNSLGENGKFTQLAQSKPYTCNYSVMNAPSDECVCPDGTEHAGEDLYPIIYNASTSANPMTCADAQLKYCNATVETYCPSDQTINITDCLKNSSFQHCVSTLCPNGSGDKFCPNDSSIKITACLNNGNSYDYCVNAICSNNVDYHCPKGTFNDGMDIKPCVFANIHMGLEAALQYCKDTVCPGGQRIIYRTISLRNPFPGKTAGAGVSYTTNKFSLDPHLGRYPGSNWNSELLVKNQILYNRNVEGNAVYQKEPLYTFILDTNTIKEIRKYNDSQEKVGGYADFTLECNSNGVACLSNQFLRESISGLIGGVCSSGAKSDFYGCAES